MSGIGKHSLGLAAAAAALILTGLLVWYGLFCRGVGEAGPEGTLVEYQSSGRMETEDFS